jgi:hypothetical protein
MPAATIVAVFAAAAVLAAACDAGAAGWAAPTRDARAAGAAAPTRDWFAPTGGAVMRAFDVGPNPFAGGQHRGADFAARPGAVVRAACGGRVVVAGRVGTSGRVVTLRCGPWRVTHMPLADVAVRAGESVRRGARLGTVAADPRHAGLHLGVRREGRRFGYVDPLQFIGAPTTPPVIAPVRPVRPDHRTGPPRHADLPAAGSSPVAAPARVVAPRAPDGVAPWFVWVGLGLLLAGAVGAAAVRLAPRRRRHCLPRAAPQEVR